MKGDINFNFKKYKIMVTEDSIIFFPLIPPINLIHK